MPILSCCRAFDVLFDGGIPRGQLTDICTSHSVAVSFSFFFKEANVATALAVMTMCASF